jgi:hypothetical protein
MSALLGAKVPEVGLPIGGIGLAEQDAGLVGGEVGGGGVFPQVPRLAAPGIC